MPLVTIIMPSLNVGKYIEKCMTSVLAQSLKDIEIICIDAGSTDGTLEIIRKYAESDSRIIIINSDVRSYGYQVNVGIKNARGRYIAILETDDWIASDMYETLYNVAVKNELDYAAADFDYVYELKNNELCFQRYRQFSKNSNMYNSVLLQEDINKLRTSDYLLWKGIYDKEFILKNKMLLHESPKAAYQDMGFLQQVKTYAKRAMYLDKSFYRYRIGRADSSTCSLEGLKFYMNEFLWINNELKILEDMSDIQKAYYYHTMSASFYYKYTELLIKLKWNYKDERLSVPYQWFANQLKNEIKKGILIEQIYDHNLWNELNILLSSESEFASEKKWKYDSDMEKYLSWEKNLQDKKVFVFGCGLIGCRTLRICDVRNIEIEAFIDNSIPLQQSGFNGYKVIAVEKMHEMMTENECVVILAVKNNKKEILEQLKNNDVTCPIIDYPTDVVLK